MVSRTDFYSKSVPIGSYSFPANSNQRDAAKQYGCTRVFKLNRDLRSLPMYGIAELKAKGYKAVRIGGTTYKSSVWGLVPIR